MSGGAIFVGAFVVLFVVAAIALLAVTRAGRWK